jgi:hypothetical protein
LGTYRADYVIWGVDVGYDNVDYDIFESEIEGAEGTKFSITYDGRGGEYAIAGYIVADGDQYEGFELQDLNNIDDVKKAQAEWAVLEAFPHVTLSDFKLLIVTTWN